MKKTILISNDDSLYAPGIAHLVAAVRDMGRVVVVAPETQCSGFGHSITLSRHLSCKRVALWEGIESYACSGTPADCVKLALVEILKEKPAICLSGINHGANHSLSVFYSGTVAAAMEALISSAIPSIAFSYVSEDITADFTQIKEYVRLILEKVLRLSEKQRAGLSLNVNFPLNDKENPIKGIKLVRQGRALFVDKALPRTNAQQETEYLMTGSFDNLDEGCRDTDFWALENGYVSMVPLITDRTDYEKQQQLRSLWEQ